MHHVSQRKGQQEVPFVRLTRPARSVRLFISGNGSFHRVGGGGEKMQLDTC